MIMICDNYYKREIIPGNLVAAPLPPPLYALFVYSKCLSSAKHYQMLAYQPLISLVYSGCDTVGE